MSLKYEPTASLLSFDSLSLSLSLSLSISTVRGRGRAMRGSRAWKRLSKCGVAFLVCVCVREGEREKERERERERQKKRERDRERERLQSACDANHRTCRDYQARKNIKSD